MRPHIYSECVHRLVCPSVGRIVRWMVTFWFRKPIAKDFVIRSKIDIAERAWCAECAYIFPKTHHWPTGLRFFQIFCMNSCELVFLWICPLWTSMPACLASVWHGSELQRLICMKRTEDDFLVGYLSGSIQNFRNGFFHCKIDNARMISSRPFNTFRGLDVPSACQLISLFNL